MTKTTTNIEGINVTFLPNSQGTFEIVIMNKHYESNTPSFLEAKRLAKAIVNQIIFGHEA